MSYAPYLPAILAEIAEVAGLPAALAIADERGGTRVHFPARAPDGHWLPELVGREAADRICAHFRSTQNGGLYVTVPLGPKNFYARARRRAEEMISNGATTDQIAASLGVHRRSVERFRARWRDKNGGRGGGGAQGSLF